MAGGKDGVIFFLFFRIIDGVLCVIYKTMKNVVHNTGKFGML